MKYAIIGFGCTGYTAAKTIRDRDRTGTIRVFNRSGNSPENPILTSYYAEGRVDETGLYPFGPIDAIQKELDLDLSAQDAVHLDCGGKRVVVADGTEEQFDSVLISTGAVPMVPRAMVAPGYEPFVLRTYQDMRRMITYLDTHQVHTAAVVGCSWVGIKVAEVLHARDIRVVMIDGMGCLFPTAAYCDVVERIYPELEKLGIIFRFNAKVKQVSEGGVLMEDGTFLPADFTCLSIGVRPNLSLIEGERIVIGRGIAVDEHMETSVPGIYAAGDCCEVYNPQTKGRSVIGLWASAAAQGAAAGNNMAGYANVYPGEIPHNITHFFHMDFVGMGDITIPGVRHSFPCPLGTVEAMADEEGKLISLNILGQYRIAGFMKNHLMKCLSGVPASLSFRQRGQLKAEGFSDAFIDFIGGGKEYGSA